MLMSSVRPRAGLIGSSIGTSVAGSTAGARVSARRERGAEVEDDGVVEHAAPAALGHREIALAAEAHALVRALERRAAACAACGRAACRAVEQQRGVRRAGRDDGRGLRGKGCRRAARRGPARGAGSMRVVAAHVMPPRCIGALGQNLDG